jgi:hypothetical protein
MKQQKEAMSRIILVLPKPQTNAGPAPTKLFLQHLIL